MDQIFALYGVLKKSANIAAIILFFLLEFFLLIILLKKFRNLFFSVLINYFRTFTPLENKLKG